MGFGERRCKLEDKYRGSTKINYYVSRTTVKKQHSHPLEVLDGPVDDLVGGVVPANAVVAGLDGQEVVVAVVGQKVVQELVQVPGGGRTGPVHLAATVHLQVWSSLAGVSLTFCTWGSQSLFLQQSIFL